MKENPFKTLLGKPNKKHLNNVLGERKNVAILYANIKNFSYTTSRLKAEEISGILSAYLNAVKLCIEKNKGSIVYHIGDRTMAYWDDALCEGKAAFLACKTALDIQISTNEIDEEVYSRFGIELSFGIGIHFGEANIIVLNESRKKEYTIVGEIVSIAKEMESLSAKGDIYISETIKDILGKSIVYKRISEQVFSKSTNRVESVFLLENITDYEHAPEAISGAYAKNNDEYFLYILGCRGSYNVSGKRFNEFGGQTTCSILKKGTHAVIFDCGTGLYDAENILMDCEKIDIILSHVHYDHCLGFLNWSVFPEGVKPSIYGNFDGWKGIRTINELFSAPFWPIDLVNANCIQIPAYGEEVDLGDDIKIKFFPANHPNGATLSSVKAGNKRMVIMVDCERSDAMPIEEVKDADFLFYDGMFDNSEYSKRIGWGHSTWQEGCELALRANVKKLLICHHAPQRTDIQLKEYEKFAKVLFKDTVFARAGMVIKI